DLLSACVRPLGRGLARMGVRPNHVTGAALCLSMLAAVLVLTGHLVSGGIVWLLASSLDLLDGAMARFEQQATRLGAFLDSTFDRVSEGVLFAAVVYHFAARGAPLEASLAAVAMLGSLLISYARARAEALREECQVGFMTRPERVLLLGVGLCFDLLALAIYVLVAGTAITVIQ